MALSAEDIREIENLYSHYCFRVDGGDAEGWTECFTPTGSFKVDDEPIHEGRDALLEFARGVIEAGQGRRWHFIANLDLTGDGNGAESHAYVLVVDVQQKLEDTPENYRASTYHDQLVKTEHGWRIDHRKVLRGKVA
jgi:3-phenylpropionate/cinnamic acid dioxygenase small subunit